MMNIIKSIRRQLNDDTGVLIIRADQVGDVPPKPYATYKLIADRKGVGQENIVYENLPDTLIEKRNEERNFSISFNIYGTTHDEAIELAQRLRKWFVFGGSFYLEENDVAVVSVSDIQNRTTFLVDSYDEKYGFDVNIRYTDKDEREIDYFNKIEL